MLNIPKHRDLSRRIAELTEELEELSSEKKQLQLLAMMDYAEDTGPSTVKKDVSAMEANLVKLEQQEQKYTAELDAALAEYNELKARTADFDPDELAMAQLEIRPQKEASAESKILAAYGEKYDFWTMIGAKLEVAELSHSGRNKKIVVWSGDTPLLFSKDRICRMRLLKTLCNPR